MLRALFVFLSLVFLGPIRAENGPLTHGALFGPNKEYPYFDRSLFESQAAGFSLANAAFFAECSYLSYVKEPEFIAERLAGFGFEEIRFVDTKGTFAVVAKRGADIVVVFRGTETADKIDYTTDAKIAFSPFEAYGKAHYGFVEALGWVNDDLDKAVDELSEGKPVQLWLAGHSLGGALATLYGLSHQENCQSVYTFGMPRVGNRKLAKSGETLPLYRIVHDNDIIARVPPPGAYVHFGALHFLTSEGELIESPTLAKKWESQRRGHVQHLKQAFEEHWKQGDFSAIPSDYFADHSPRFYADKLKALAFPESNTPIQPSF